MSDQSVFWKTTTNKWSLCCTDSTANWKCLKMSIYWTNVIINHKPLNLLNRSSPPPTNFDVNYTPYMLSYELSLPMHSHRKKERERERRMSAAWNVHLCRGLFFSQTLNLYLVWSINVNSYGRPFDLNTISRVKRVMWYAPLPEHMQKTKRVETWREVVSVF